MLFIDTDIRAENLEKILKILSGDFCFTLTVIIIINQLFYFSDLYKCPKWIPFSMDRLVQNAR